jgi:hypothetical protein
VLIHYITSHKLCSIKSRACLGDTDCILEKMMHTIHAIVLASMQDSLGLLVGNEIDGRREETKKDLHTRDRI